MIDKTVEELIEEIINEPKYEEYIVVFQGHEGIDTIRFEIAQIDRPNGMDNIDLIREYILNNYGYKDYEIIAIDLIKRVRL